MPTGFLIFLIIIGVISYAVSTGILFLVKNKSGGDKFFIWLSMSSYWFLITVTLIFNVAEKVST